MPSFAEFPKLVTDDMRRAFCTAMADYDATGGRPNPGRDRIINKFLALNALDYERYNAYCDGLVSA